MKTALPAILAVLTLSAGGALAANEAVHYAPVGGPQPGICGPEGCFYEDNLYGLSRNPPAFHALCTPYPSYYSAPHDSRSRACFDIGTYLEGSLSNPHPQRLYGFVDESDTRFVLLAGQSVTVNNRVHLVVSEPQQPQYWGTGCAEVRHYELPWYNLQYVQVWCPGLQQPILIYSS
ncbi:related to conserved hypothetical Ustilaginaceae-specific protein [Ustilago trichophora]|uniref:Related to conserved hypothetical Ustilaginaceae-specific protein n=1 Tax=Ustilago trichophora TaxID=86804 RepID=A0A5C3DTM0_9BASI|nr:related to conserved hypothetical Ustilaginaceae-specific protein [Ustilago trichophora]